MAFVPKDWRDSPDTTTPITAVALENLETRVTDYTDTSILFVTALLTVVPADIKNASYTLVLTDAGRCIEMNSASATTVTIPPNASVAFPIGTVLELFRLGAGTVTVAPGSGVTPIRSPGGLTLTNQYSSASLRKRGTNEWVISGDLA